MLTFHRHVEQERGAHELLYAPRDRSAQGRQGLSKLSWRVFWVALFALALATGWRFAKQAQYLYWQHACMTYQQPTNAVAFDAQLAQTPPKEARVLPDRTNAAYVFIHERKSQSGARRLVTVHVDHQYIGLSFISTSYTPATIQPKSVLVIGPGRSMPFTASAAGVKVYAGQPDARDESHFTIRALDAGKSRNYDGWLGDDGVVTIEERRD
jgi:hypothetical protein